MLRYAILLGPILNPWIVKLIEKVLSSGNAFLKHVSVCFKSPKNSQVALQELQKNGFESESFGFFTSSHWKKSATLCF